MVVSIKTGGTAASVVAWALAGALTAACAGTAPASGASDRAATMRVMVKLVRASDDPAAIAAEAERVAGVHVRHAAAAGANWHALALQCDGAAACDAAIARLRAAASVYQAVEIEGRKKATAS